MLKRKMKQNFFSTKKMIDLDSVKNEFNESSLATSMSQSDRMRDALKKYSSQTIKIPHSNFLFSSMETQKLFDKLANALIEKLGGDRSINSRDNENSSSNIIASITSLLTPTKKNTSKFSISEIIETYDNFMPKDPKIMPIDLVNAKYIENYKNNLFNKAKNHWWTKYTGKKDNIYSSFFSFIVVHNFFTDISLY